MTDFKKFSLCKNLSSFFLLGFQALVFASLSWQLELCGFWFCNCKFGKVALQIRRCNSEMLNRCAVAQNKSTIGAWKTRATVLSQHLFRHKTALYKSMSLAESRYKNIPCARSVDGYLFFIISISAYSFCGAFN